MYYFPPRENISLSFIWRNICSLSGNFVWLSQSSVPTNGKTLKRSNSPLVFLWQLSITISPTDKSISHRYSGYHDRGYLETQGRGKTGVNHVHCGKRDLTFAPIVVPTEIKMFLHMAWTCCLAKLSSSHMCSRCWIFYVLAIEAFKKFSQVFCQVILTE